MGGTENKETGGSENHYSSTELWLRISIVVIIGLVLVIIWLFTGKASKDFAEHFSFASTVASIILSVLAIFMSVSGEAKTQVIRDRIEQEADDIEKVASRLGEDIQKLSGRIEVIVHNTDNIKASISENPGPVQVTSATNAVTSTQPTTTEQR